jgi:hypothetical protein
MRTYAPGMRTRKPSGRLWDDLAELASVCRVSEPSAEEAERQMARARSAPELVHCRRLKVVAGEAGDKDLMPARWARRQRAKRGEYEQSSQQRSSGGGGGGAELPGERQTGEHGGRHSTALARCSAGDAPAPYQIMGGVMRRKSIK